MPYRSQVRAVQRDGRRNPVKACGEPGRKAARSRSALGRGERRRRLGGPFAPVERPWLRAGAGVCGWPMSIMVCVPKAGAEGEFVRGLARVLGHEFLLHQAGGLRPGLSMEESCRRTRHDWLAEQAARVGARATALGHHPGRPGRDLALPGPLAAAAPPTGRDAAQSGRVMAAFAGYQRADLREYLEGLGQNWQSDPSNLDLGPLRNRVRQPHFAPGQGTGE